MLDPRLSRAALSLASFIVMDWIMKRTVERDNRSKWKFTISLVETEILITDFADTVTKFLELVNFIIDLLQEKF